LRAREDVERLVRIPSVSAPDFDPANVRASAEATAELLGDAGYSGTRLLEIDGAHPAVFAESAGPEGAPTVLLYAHHDVQPPGDAALWETPPFEPVERDGRLFGRGSADDKAGIGIHAAAMRAHGGTPPVNAKVLVEGEEETGSEHLAEFLERYGEMLAADVVVIADSGNWQVGVPALTTSLRGLVDCIVEVRTLDHAVHSGVYGGPLPDALMVLSRLLSSLHDDDGQVRVRGLTRAERPAIDLEQDDYLREAGARPGVRMLGDGTIAQRLWMRPALSILGIDAPAIRESSNQLVPRARARVSLRLAPGDDPRRALDALVAHLEANAPWGAEVRVERGAGAEPFQVEARGPAFEAAHRAFEDAWGAPAVEMGMGGTIPLVAAFSSAYPKAAMLLTGAGDPDSRAHGENESLHLGDFERACVAEALLLSYLATG
jgi:acetylornithine deacetylase/succinyl-diaminopimelate desuccinylase-like protein